MVEQPEPHNPNTQAGAIRVGIGGWTFAPWRGAFYPDGLPQSQELAYASRQVTSIEVNGTFYRTQTPATFAKWAAEVPDGFVFSLKGPRAVTNRRILAEAGPSIDRFLHSGISELKRHLGPLLWQLAPNKKFDAADLEGFLDLLPPSFDGRPLRHVLEVRHPSFAVPAFTTLLRRFRMPVVFAEHGVYPQIADLTGDFVYVRLQKGEDRLKAGYPPAELDRWAERLRQWAAGGAPVELPITDRTATPESKPRDVFAYVIHEGKVRAPAAAIELIRRTTDDRAHATRSASPRLRASATKESSMPAKSKAQQKAAGAALSAKRGETKTSKLKGASRSMAGSMSETQLEELASTKRKPLPARKRLPTRKGKS